MPMRTPAAAGNQRHKRLCKVAFVNFVVLVGLPPIRERVSYGKLNFVDVDMLEIGDEISTKCTKEEGVVMTGLGGTGNRERCR